MTKPKKPWNKKEVRAEILPVLLDYNPETGKFFWKTRAAEYFPSPTRAKIWNTQNAGKQAFLHVMKNGYLSGGIFKNTFYAHRVAWAIVHGSWPTMAVDHINRDPKDNRIANLRLATHSDNSRNGSVHKDNATGFKGVIRNRDRAGSFISYIYVNGKHKRLGTFETAEAAHLAYIAAAKQHFGEFACGGER